MVFECLYRSFCRIYTMVVWFNELQLDILASYVVLYRLGTLIVGDIEIWFVALR